MIISCVLSHALLPSLLKELSSLWVCSGAVPALLSAAPGEPGVQHNCKQRFIASLAVTHTCGSVFPLTPSLIYFNLILLSGSVIQQEFVEVIWFYLLKKLGILQQIHFKNSYSKGKLLPLLLLYVIMFVFIYCLFPLFFVVGGVRSPWKGEYREPRHFSLTKKTVHRHPCPPQWAQFLRLVLTQNCQSKFPVPAQSYHPHLWSKQRRLREPTGMRARSYLRPTIPFLSPQLLCPWRAAATWKEPQPFRSKNFSSWKLVSAGLGEEFSFFFAWEQDKNTAAFSWPVDSYFRVFSLDVILLIVPFSLHKLLNLPLNNQN